MKCKNCKEVFEPKWFNWKFCDKDLCHNLGVKDLVKKEREKKAKQEWKETKKAKEALLTHRDYLKLFQTVFNTYIRERDKDLPCISCGKPQPYDLAAGHFYAAGNYSFLRFNELNVHGQCNAHCNMHLSGNPHEYRKNITKRITQNQLDWLDDNCKKELKLSIPEIKVLITKYKNKVRALK
jgi:hypothetical protein